MKDHTVLKVFLIVLVAAFVIHQAYSAFYNPVTTQNAEFYSASDGITADAIALRHETVVLNNSAGALHYKTLSGSRVEKGGTIADIYSDKSASVTVNRIEELTSKISDIEEISGYNDVAAADLNLVNDKVIDALNNFVVNSSAGRYGDIENSEKELLFAENRKQFITGETVDFSGQLTTLKAERDSLSAKLPTPVGSIKSDRSGCFVSAVDGYENLFSLDSLDEITPEAIESAVPEKTPDNAIGKIVYDYDWYVVATISINDSLKYKPGDELTVKTTIRTTPTVNAVVKQINVSKNDDKAALVLLCGEMNSEIATMRNAKITLVSKEYSGLKIDKKALRVVKGKTGVYVVSGRTVKFVGVNVIYNTDAYILCEQENENESESQVLRLYDEVVVKGKNLYDGKIIG